MTLSQCTWIGRLGLRQTDMCRAEARCRGSCYKVCSLAGQPDFGLEMMNNVKCEKMYYQQDGDSPGAILPG